MKVFLSVSIYDAYWWVTQPKMCKSKANVLDNWLIFYFKQSDPFFLAKVSDGFIWKT
jgi:hypothetical protein